MVIRGHALNVKSAYTPNSIYTRTNRSGFPHRRGEKRGIKERGGGIRLPYHQAQYLLLHVRAGRRVWARKKNSPNKDHKIMAGSCGGEAKKKRKGERKKKLKLQNNEKTKLA